MTLVACAEMKRQLSTRKLAKAMQAKGWGPKHLAAFADLALPTVADILDGKSGGQTATLVKIADALGVEDLNSLFDRLE